MITSSTRKQTRRRERRGVGAVIGGVILVTILITSVLIYFLAVLNSEKVRASYDIQSQQADQAKAAEVLTVVRADALDCDPAPCVMTLSITNDGALPSIITNILLYCIDTACPAIPIPAGTDPNDPVEQLPGGTPMTLNAMERNTRTIGPVDDAMTYRIDVITERGNIISAVECLVDAAAGICVDTGGSTGADFEITAAPSAFTMTPTSSRTSTLTIYSLNGFNAPVDISVSSPPDITATPNPVQVTPPNPGSATSTLTITASPTLAQGTYILTVTGTSGALTHSVQITVSTLSVTGAVNEGIIQGTGSLQLDFKAFGAIYPQLAIRDGVDQRGWNVVVSSKYGSATGYPGFELQTVSQGNTQVILVEKARNLDPAGADLILNRNTGLLTSNDQVQGTPPPSNYICKEDKTIPGVLPYNEGANQKVLAAIPIEAPLTTGWEELFFCNTTPGNTGSPWGPANKFSNLNGIFLIARGTFEDIWAPYAQTVPYQAMSLGKGNSNPEGGLLSACLRETNVATACSAPTVADNAASLRYSALESEMQTGVTVWLHLNTGAAILAPYNVAWLYPDGTYARIVTDQATLNANNNIQVNLPTTNSDGSTFECSGSQDEYRTLLFSDEFQTGGNGNGKRYAYYFTFKIDCP